MSYKNQALRSYFPSHFSVSLKRILRFYGVLFGLAAACANAQQPIEVTEDVLKAAMREADSFSLKEGNPPVYRGYKGDASSPNAELVGYLFETPDYPPEEVGYSAPIDVLVGIELDGTLTGIEVLHYIESYKSIRGDFINSEYFPQQFSRKNIVEDFRVGRDIDGISRATITSWAVARGVHAPRPASATARRERADTTGSVSLLPGDGFARDGSRLRVRHSQSVCTHGCLELISHTLALRGVRSGAFDAIRGQLLL